MEDIQIHRPTFAAIILYQRVHRLIKGHGHN